MIFYYSFALAGRCSDLVQLGHKPLYFSLFTEGIHLVLVNYILSQQRGRVFHLELQVLHLVAWSLSIVPFEPQAFRGKLPSLSVELGESLLQSSRHISVGGVVNEA